MHADAGSAEAEEPLMAAVPAPQDLAGAGKFTPKFYYAKKKFRHIKIPTHI
jgi:hypothetical protein